MAKGAKLAGERYRVEIDALRAFAVLPVVLFHADVSLFGIQLFQGGFVGVDVFFVISGYLITGILLRELSTGSFTYRGFYARRVRRIAPALLLTLTASCAAANLLLLPEQMIGFLRSAAATIGFSSNIYFWHARDYFSPAAAITPLIHTWTLAVEEQFYIVFPAILAVLHRFANRRVLPVFAVLALASFATAVWIGFRSPDAAFYLGPFRAWELLLGAILAAGEPALARRKIAPPNDWLAGSCILLLLVMTNWPMAAWSAPLSALLPTLAAAGFILWARPDGRIVRALTVPPLVTVGLISYSLYLIHQPLFAFMRIFWGNDLPQLVRWLLVIVSLGLAYASWRFVETPFRGRGRVDFRAAAVGGVALACCVLGIFVWDEFSRGFPQRWDQETLDLIDAPRGFLIDGKDCFHNRCVIGDVTAKPSVALKGDSHAGMFVADLNEDLARSGISVLTLADGEALTTKFPAFYQGAAQQNQILEQHLKILADPAIGIIVHSVRATIHVQNRPYDNGEGGVELNDDWNGGRTDTEKQMILDGMRRAILGQRDAGKKIILVYPVPEVGWSPLDETVRRRLWGSTTPITTSYAAYKQRNALVSALYDALVDDRTIFGVHPDHYLCSEATGRCVTQLDGHPAYIDSNHLSRFGAAPIAAEIARLIAQLSNVGDPR